jgi:hypothetical protein
MSRKSHSYGHAEDVIREYWDSRKILAELRANKIGATPNKPEVLISGRGRNGDDTARRAMDLVTDPQIRYLQDTVRSVECALGDFKADSRYEAMYKIIELFYWKGTHTVLGAAGEVGYSERQAKRLKGAFVRRVISYLGW